MINKINEIPSFSLFNNFEIIRKMKFKINEIIDSINNTPAPSGSGINYSLDEQKIGTAFGEDLYQRTYEVEVDSLTDATLEFESDVNHIIDTKVMYFDNTIDHSDSSARAGLAVPNYYTSSNKGNYMTSDYYNDGEDEINAYIQFDNLNIAYTHALVTIQYTKR